MPNSLFIKNRFKEEDYENMTKEATEMKEVPSSAGASLMKHSSNKVAGKVKPKGASHGNGAVASTVDGKGKPLPDAVSKMTGKDNKVNAPGYKVGDFFK